MREIKNWTKSPLLVVSLLLRPAIWIFVFGAALNAAFFAGGSGLANSLGGAPDYFSFLTVGMLSTMPMLLATRAGASFFADRFTGFMNRLLVAPVSRSTIAISKVLGTVLLGLAQSILLLVIALPFGLTITNITLVSVSVSFVSVFLLSWGFASTFLLLSIRVKRWTDQQLLTSLNFPIMFFSKAFYPSQRLPVWIRGLANVNPLSYSADITRNLMFGTDSLVSSPTVLVGFAVLVVFAIVSFALVLLLAWKAL